MRKDILLDDNFQVVIDNQDMVIANSDEQHVQLLAITEKGAIKYNPTAGFGLYSRLKQRVANVRAFERELKIELELDGYGSASIDTSEGVNNVKIEL